MADFEGGITVSHKVRVRDQSGRFIAEVHEACEEAAEMTASRIAWLAREIAPFRTGELRMSIDGWSQGTTGWAEATAPHAVFMEFGTGAHDIPGSFGRPPPWGFGEAWGRPGAWHPGNDAFNFMDMAGKEVASMGVGWLAPLFPK